MTIRICTAAILAMFTAPAHADAFPDSLPSDPARPGWRPPTARAYVPLVGNHYDFDPGAGPLTDPSVEDAIWLSPFGTFGSWGKGTAPVSVLTPDVVTPCRPPAAVPGPLPALGLGAAFAYSRKLRQRVR